METIAEKTKRIITDTLGLEQNVLSNDSDLHKDLGADSLDVVDLVMRLEKEFKVSIPDEKLERMNKVSHFIEYFEKVSPIPWWSLPGCRQHNNWRKRNYILLWGSLKLTLRVIAPAL